LGFNLTGIFTVAPNWLAKSSRTSPSSLTVGSP
jgi:hypothetical protein